MAELFGRALVKRESPEAVAQDVVAYRSHHRTLHYCLENGLPPAA